MSNELTKSSHRGSSDIVNFSDEKFNRISAMASILSQGGSVISKDIAESQADCMAIVIQSGIWGMNPFSVASKCFIVRHKLSYEAQLINAVGNKFAPLKQNLTETYIGDWSKIENKHLMKQSDKSSGSYAVRGWTNEDEQGLGIVISGHIIGEKEPRNLTVMMAQCAIRNSTLWVTFPQQQIFYFATKMWFRRYCPEAILGMYSPEEIQETAIDVEATVIDDEPASTEEVTPETMSKLEELVELANESVKSKVRERIKNVEGESLTQELAENLIAWVSNQNENAAKNEALKSSLLKKLHATGNEAFPGTWDKNRPIMIGAITNNTKSSSKDLTIDQLSMLIDQLEITIQENSESESAK